MDRTRQSPASAASSTSRAILQPILSSFRLHNRGGCTGSRALALSAAHQSRTGGAPPGRQPWPDGAPASDVPGETTPHKASEAGMGKAQRIRATNARERIAAQQAAARRAEARKRMYLASGSVLGVIAIVLGLIIWKSAGSSTAVGGHEGDCRRGEPGHQADHYCAGEYARRRRQGQRRRAAAPDQRTARAGLWRQARDPLHGRGVLPVLRRRAVGHGGGAQPVRHVLQPEPDPLRRLRTSTRTRRRSRSTDRATPASTSASRRWRCTASRTTASRCKSRRPPSPR